MQIINDIREMQKFADNNRCRGKTIGFVPTMGFLHEGHLSLIRIARAKCDILIVSIFVNPTQFGQNEDLSSYPRDLARDEKLCQKERVDVIFNPTAEQMYQKPYRAYINLEEITETMCGASRPGHFRGVATVVGKLFNIVKPHLAVFGQKDFQQALVIKQMVRDLNFDVKILTGPIVREPDGLALSSRNKYLISEERKNALVLFNSLQLAQELVKRGIYNSGEVRRQLEQLINSVPGTAIDYIAIVNADTLKVVSEIKNNTLIALAVFVGKTRLIDNTVIKIA